jgi:hypothetical protein
MSGSTLAPLPHPAFPQEPTLQTRELALLNLFGVVVHAIGNLNLNDPPAALRTLMEGLEFYTRATSSEKENSDGNRRATA